MAEVRVGDRAPEVTLVNPDRQQVRLSELLGQPLVLAFFPAAFSNTCTKEMCTFRDTLHGFDDIGVRVIGISVDMPYAQKAWAEQHTLSFPLLSDYNREAVKAFGVEDPTFAKGVLPGVARRSVFVLDKDGTVTYRWVSDVPSVEPNYAEVEEAARRAGAGARV
ncbi:MAG: redoxin domain-containing protein [Armatimonadetes bacterium]|nr:redoxin domain-containing protein [Armatimonadota bacterium]